MLALDAVEMSSAEVIEMITSAYYEDGESESTLEETFRG